MGEAGRERTTTHSPASAHTSAEQHSVFRTFPCIWSAHAGHPLCYYVRCTALPRLGICQGDCCSLQPPRCECGLRLQVACYPHGCQLRQHTLECHNPGCAVLAVVVDACSRHQRWLAAWMVIQLSPTTLFRQHSKQQGLGVLLLTVLWKARWVILKCQLFADIDPPYVK